MACRFPAKASNLDAFWQVLVEGGDWISEVPAQRWNWHVYADELTSHHGCYLNDIEYFDPAFFHISLREAETMTRNNGCFWKPPGKHLNRLA